jgi:uncharacterized protein YkwD
MRRCCLLLLTLLLALQPGGIARAAEPGCQPPGEAVVAALNAVRASAQTCGRRVWPASAPLRENPLLALSAQRYAHELAARDRVDHIGAAGDTLRARLRAAGYVMRVSGENLAGGPETLDEALGQWLASPAHCDNLMLADFQEFGLACVTGPGRYQRYWVLHLAAPASARP